MAYINCQILLLQEERQKIWFFAVSNNKKASKNLLARVAFFL